MGTVDYEANSTVLGKGMSGEVKLATSRRDGTKYAIKAFTVRGASRAKMEELEAECEIFLGMDHPHVARLMDVYQTTEQVVLVMEYMAGGEMFDRLVEQKRYCER